MTEDQKQALQQLATSAGWTVLKDLMRQRVDKAKLEALMNPNEEEFIKLYRHLYATDDAVAAIVQTVEDFTEPVPAIFFGEDEEINVTAEF